MLSPFERLPRHAHVSIFEYAVHAGTAHADGVHDVAVRLAAPRRAARLMVSRAVYGAAREVMFVALTLRPDERMMAYVADVLEGGLGDTVEGHSEAQQLRTPRVRALEIDVTQPIAADPETGLMPGRLVMGLLKVLKRVGPTILDFRFAFTADDLIALLLVEQVFNFAGFMWKLRCASMHVQGRRRMTAEVGEMLGDILSGALRTFGPVAELEVDFSAAKLHEAFGVASPVKVPELMAVKCFLARNVPGQLVGAVAAASGRTMQRLYLIDAFRHYAFDPPLEHITMLTVMDLTGQHAWHTLPALRGLEVTVLCSVADLDWLPNDVELLHLHIGVEVNDLLKIVKWLDQRELPGLGILQLTTYDDFDSRGASPDARDALAQACRARAIRLQLADELGRWSMSA